MIRFFFFVAALLVVLVSCRPQQSDADVAILDMYTTRQDSIVIPPFEIEVIQSALAGDSLAAVNETVIVSAYFWGDPLKEKDQNEMGQLDIAAKDIELIGSDRVARFEGITFSKKQYAKLDDKEIRVLINIYSGRKSSEYNLLTCGILDEPVSVFAHKRFTMGCTLIAEPTPGGTSATPLSVRPISDGGTSK